MNRRGYVSVTWYLKSSRVWQNFDFFFIFTVHTFGSYFKTLGLGLERWLGNQVYLLYFQRTWVWFPAPTIGSTVPSVTNFKRSTDTTYTNASPHTHN